MHICGSLLHNSDFIGYEVSITRLPIIQEIEHM